LKKTNKKNKIFPLVINWLPVFVWAAIIFSFSSLRSPKASDFFLFDFIVKKTSHVLEYAILYVLIFRATSKNLVLSYFLVILYAATDEFHQSFIVGRTATPLDLGFDGSGANISAYLLWKLKQIQPKKVKR